MPPPSQDPSVIAPLLFRSSSALHAEFSRVLDRLGVDLTPEQGMTLAIIMGAGAQSVTSLAALMSKDRTTVSRFVDLLRSAGLVESAASTEDRRNQLVSITPQGREVMAKVQPAIRGTVLGLVEGIPSEDLETTARVLHTLMERVNDRG